MVLDSLLSPDILTIKFETGDEVMLQYHPDQLVINHISNTSSVSGVTDLITFVSNPNTTTTNISLSTYLTATKPFGEGAGQIATGTGVGVSLALSGAGATNNSAVQTVLDTISYGTTAIALSKGLFDITTGVFSPRSINPLPNATAIDQFTKLIILADALDNGWLAEIKKLDVIEQVYNGHKFIINNMNIDIESINDATAESMIIKVMLNIIKAGNTVRIK